MSRPARAAVRPGSSTATSWMAMQPVRPACPRPLPFPPRVWISTAPSRRPAPRRAAAPFGACAWWRRWPRPPWRRSSSWRHATSPGPPDPRRASCAAPSRPLRRPCTRPARCRTAPLSCAGAPWPPPARTTCGSWEQTAPYWARPPRRRTPRSPCAPTRCPRACRLPASSPGVWWRPLPPAMSSRRRGCSPCRRGRPAGGR
jgi:hypothetical protein